MTKPLCTVCVQLPHKLHTDKTYFCQIVCCLLHCHVSQPCTAQSVKPEHSITVAASHSLAEGGRERGKDGAREERQTRGEGRTV